MRDFGKRTTKRYARQVAISVALAGVMVMPVSVYAQPDMITGKARVVDGDTIDIGTTRIRLWGIDAPEGKQQCQLGEKAYLCGNEASKELVVLVGSKDVECLKKTQDRYKRTVAVCRVGSMDLGAEMVRRGWALAFVRYSSDYVAQENEARLARRGMWAGTFDAPWDVR